MRVNIADILREEQALRRKELELIDDQEKIDRERVEKMVARLTLDEREKHVRREAQRIRAGLADHPAAAVKRDLNRRAARRIKRDRMLFMEECEGAKQTIKALNALRYEKVKSTEMNFRATVADVAHRKHLAAIKIKSEAEQLQRQALNQVLTVMRI